MFKYKFDIEEYLIKYKIRLCARKNLQQTNQNVYAVILIIRIFKTFMIIVIVFNLNTRQYNAINAFVNSDIDEFIYCKLFDEWKEVNVLFLLLKAFYELKQSSVLWYKHLFNTLNELKLKQISEIECFFINDYMIFFFFVNDIIILYHSRNVKQMNEFEQKLFNAYEMRNMNEIEWFLNIRVTQNRKLHQMFFCQNSYVDKLINKFNINTFFTSSKASLTNFVQMMKNKKTVTLQQIHAYQQ